jgi:hypothetical protein
VYSRSVTRYVPWQLALAAMFLGLVLIATGYATAFSDAGAIIVYLGLGAILGGIVALARAPLWLATAVGVVIAALPIIPLLANSGA